MTTFLAEVRLKLPPYLTIQKKVSPGSGGVLTRQELIKLNVIPKANKRSYQLTSYDLRLGSCHYVFDNLQQYGDKQQDKAKWRLVHIGSEKELASLNSSEKGSQKYEPPESARHTLIIPPYGSAIIELKEIVDTYTAAVKHNILIVGRFDLKLSQVYQALISQQATQVEPLYQGKLYCFIHNLSGNEISLEEGEKIATIEFSYAGEHLSPEQRKALIDQHKNEKIDKYTKSLYAHKNQRGIGEVRWFYEQDRLPLDCGLNGLHVKVERDVKEAVNRFDREFGTYVEKDETLAKIAEKVSSRIKEEQRSLEILVSVVTGAVTFGLGSLIWMFYQELVKVIERQTLISTYLSGNPDALAISQIEITAELSPLLLPYAALILILVITFFAIYIYTKHKKKTIDQEVQSAVRRELLVLENELTSKVNGLLKEQNNLNRRYDFLTEKLYGEIESQKPESTTDA